MADYYSQGCFAFRCTAGEAALLAEAFSASEAILLEEEIAAPSPALQAAFPAVSPGEPWSGFVGIFDFPDHPSFGADIEIAGDAQESEMRCVTISGSIDFQPDPIAALIRRSCTITLEAGPIGFQWAMNCSRLRLDGFGGGWCAIFADRTEMGSTLGALARALASNIAEEGLVRGVWDDHPDHALSDWQYAVANDDTRCSYLAWIDAQGRGDSLSTAVPTSGDDGGTCTDAAGSL